MSKNLLAVICALFIFLTIVVFFTYVKPVVPFDADDWLYVSKTVSYPVPTILRWNPTRIFPEYLEPITGYFAAYVIYPLTGDYLFSMSLAAAIMLASFISALYIALYSLFLALNKDRTICALAGATIIALYFALFKSNDQSNTYMFYGRTYTLAFFYTAPNILNSIAVCVLARRLILYGSLSIAKFSKNPRC